jgi:hypothetical protein
MDIVGVLRRHRLDQHDSAFFLENRIVYRATGYDTNIARAEGNLVIGELNDKTALQHLEQFVLCIILVPGELVFELGDPDVLVVDMGDTYGTQYSLRSPSAAARLIGNYHFE